MRKKTSNAFIIFCTLLITQFFIDSYSFSQKNSKVDFGLKIVSISDNQKKLIFEYVNKYQCSYFLGIIDTIGNFFNVDSIAEKSKLKNKSDFLLSCEGVIKKIIDSFYCISYTSFTVKKFFSSSELDNILKENSGRFTFIFITAGNKPNFFKKKIKKWNNYILKKEANANILVLEM
jgi:hypothetical protein